MNALIVTGAQAVTITHDAEAIKFRDEQLERSRAILQINDPKGVATLKNHIRALKALSRDVEQNRTAVKAEPLRITQQIDLVAKTFVAPIDAEIQRLEGLANAFAAEQARLVKEAEAKAQADRDAEEKKIREEAEAKKKALREQAEEEQRKLAAQTPVTPPTSPTAEPAQSAPLFPSATPAPEQPPVVSPFAAAQLEIKRQREELKIDAAAEQQRAAAALRAVVQAPAIETRTVWKWKVVDGLELAKARPELVTISPSVREINALVAKGLRELPGVQIYEATEAKL